MLKIANFNVILNRTLVFEKTIKLKLYFIQWMTYTKKERYKGGNNMKNCVNCGAPLDDAAGVCNNCGSGQPQMAPQQPQMGQMGQPQGGFVQPMMGQPMAPQQPQMGYGQPQQNQFADQLKDAGNQVSAAVKKIDPKIIIGVAAGLVAIILIVFLTKLFGPGSLTLKGAVNDYYDAIVEQDGEAYIDCMYSSKMIKAIEKETDEDYDDLVDDMEDYFDYSDIEKIKEIEIEDKDKLDKDDREDIEKSFRKMYDYKPNITKAYEVEVSYEYYDSWYEDWEDAEETLLVFKVGGKWYVSEWY